MCLNRDHEWGKYWRKEKSEIPPEVLDDMAAAWDHFGSEIMAQLESPARHWAGGRPHGWWLFEAPAEHDPNKDRRDELEEWGLMGEAELAELRKDARGIMNEFYCSPFRRSWEWWRFLSPERRDYSMSEAEQLCRLDGPLCERERHLRDHHCEPPAMESIVKHYSADVRELLTYLGITDEERRFLGLPD